MLFERQISAHQIRIGKLRIGFDCRAQHLIQDLLRIGILQQRGLGEDHQIARLTIRSWV